MNLVETIKNQLFSDGHLFRLSSLIGATENATKSAVGAAVPSLLTALSHVTSSGGSGAQNLVSALGDLDSGAMSKAAHMLSGHAESVLEQGNGLLSSLFSGSTVSGIVNAISKFSGIGGAAVQKLLGYLMPMVLGAIAGRFAGKAASAQALTSMLADQNASIANALPSGFSLKDVPGLASVGSAARGAVEAAPSAASSLLKWALPVAALAAIAFVAWWFFHQPGQPPPLNVPAPDVSRLTTDLTGDFKSLTDTFADIKDAASAGAAVPKLTEINRRLDELKAMAEKLPAAERGKITELIKPSLAKLEEQFAKLQWIPGVSDIQPTVDGVMDKLASLGGLPAPQLPQVNGELAGAFSSLTDSLKGIKDAATAEAALPELTKINGKLDHAKASMDKLPTEGKATIISLLKPALVNLKELTDKVLAMAGVSEKIKPVIDGITGKLSALVG
jgi:hypothetical protein